MVSLVPRLAALVLLLLLAGACAPQGASGDRPLVMTSTTVLADIVRNVAGDGVQVDSVIPLGADAHEFQASASQAQQLRRAKVVFIFGLGFEDSLRDFFDVARKEGVPVVELAPGLNPLPFAETSPQSAGEAGQLDPHVFLDPLRMADATAAIADALAKAIPGQADGFKQRAATYRETLTTLNTEVDSLLAPVPASRRLLVTSHEAFGYYAKRYGFTIIGVVIPGGSTTGAPSAAEIARLADVVKRKNVPAIFTETTSQTSVAQALAREVGREVKLVELYSETLGPAGSGADTYVRLIRTDSQRIASALK